MKKFKFTMDSIKNIKDTLKEAAEIELAEARIEVRKAKDALDELNRLLEKTLVISVKKLTGLYFLQREKCLRKIKIDIKTQKFKVQEAEGKAAVCLSKLQEAIKESKKMVKVYDREKARWDIAFNRDEQKNNDEIATRLSFAKKLKKV